MYAFAIIDNENAVQQRIIVASFGECQQNAEALSQGFSVVPNNIYHLGSRGCVKVPYLDKRLKLHTYIPDLVVSV